MAGVTTEKRGNKWRYRFDVSSIDGKRSRISKGGFDTEKDAMAAGVQALADYNRAGVRFQPSEISYGDYLDEWMDVYCRRNLKPETIVNYEKRIRLHIRPKLEKYKLKMLTSALLQELINEKAQQGYSRNTLTTIKGILTTSLEYAVEPMRYIDRNPAAHVRLPSPRAKTEVPTRSVPHVYITPEQIKMILDRFPEGTSAHIPIQLGYRCGLRIGEAFGIFWDDVDLDVGKLSINRQIQWSKDDQLWYFTEPKYDSFRTIDLDDSIVELLRREKERQVKAAAYFGDERIQLFESPKRLVNKDGDGNRIDMVMVRPDGSLIAPRIMQHASGIIHSQLKFPEFDFHSLRHTHTSVMLAAGAPLKYVQDRLGHKKPDVTLKIYQHTTEVIENHGKSILGEVFDR